MKQTKREREREREIILLSDIQSSTENHITHNKEQTIKKKKHLLTHSLALFSCVFFFAVILIIFFFFFFCRGHLQFG